MKLSKWAMVLLLFIVITCRSEIITGRPSSAKSTSSLVENLIKIIESCYGDRIYGVGLVGSLPDALSRTLFARHMIPVVLIDRTENVNHDARRIENVVTVTNKYTVPIQFRWKLSVFIVKASSWQELIDIVLSIGHTIWSNPMASFFILDRSPECVNSKQFLSIAWNINLLHAKVMCYGHKSEKIIISYNPFTSEAPLPWHQVGVFVEDGRHPYVLFSRKYGEREAICVNLDFDKTKDLGGYEITVEGLPPGTDVRLSTDLADHQFWRTNERILNTIYHAMNATSKFTGLRRWNADLDVDMKKLANFIVAEWRYSFKAYPHHHTGFLIVSQFRDQKSQPYRILPVIEIYSRIGLGIVYLVTLIFFRFCVHQPLVSAFLNLIRITCNTAFANLPQPHTLRIYVTGLLLFAVAVQVIYHCHLALLLMTRISPRNVDTMADLQELGFTTIYGLHNDRHIIETPNRKIRYEGVYDIDDCVTSAKRNSSAVCITTAVPSLFSQAQAFGLHVSSEFVMTTYVAFEIRDDWPLEQRINVIIARIVEGDLLRPWDVRCSSTRLVDFELTDYQRERFRKNKIFEKIDLGELSCAFVILGVGLACATVVFIAELVIRYKCRIVRRPIMN